VQLARRPPPLFHDRRLLDTQAQVVILYDHTDLLGQGSQKGGFVQRKSLVRGPVITQPAQRVFPGAQWNAQVA
jgi:hypothetical protein